MVSGKYTPTTPTSQFLTRKGYGKRTMKEAGVLSGNSGLLVLLSSVTYRDRLDNSISFSFLPGRV